MNVTTIRSAYPEVDEYGAQKTWKSTFGDTMYTQEVEFDNGMAGRVNAKSPDKWKVGDKVEIKSGPDQYGTIRLGIPREDGGQPRPQGNGAPAPRQASPAPQKAPHKTVTDMGMAFGIVLRNFLGQIPEDYPGDKGQLAEKASLTWLIDYLKKNDIAPPTDVPGYTPPKQAAEGPQAGADGPNDDAGGQVPF